LIVRFGLAPGKRKLETTKVAGRLSGAKMAEKGLVYAGSLFQDASGRFVIVSSSTDRGTVTVFLFF
jgi:hypothetical protein